MPTFAILSFVAMPFQEDLRKAVIGLGISWGDRLFDVFLTGGFIGLVVVLVLKSDRAARTCEDLREQLKGDLTDHRNRLKKDLAHHREQLRKDLEAVVDSRVKPITDGIGTLQSHVDALGSRLAALESRITALNEMVAHFIKAT